MGSPWLLNQQQAPPQAPRHPSYLISEIAWLVSHQCMQVVIASGRDPEGCLEGGILLLHGQDVDSLDKAGACAHLLRIHDVNQRLLDASASVTSVTSVTGAEHLLGFQHTPLRRLFSKTSSPILYAFSHLHGQCLDAAQRMQLTSSTHYSGFSP